MVIKPILFNTEMVRAILNGRKTCTRRILKGAIPFGEKAEYWNVLKKGEWSGPICTEHFIKQCSPYNPGDILYVRETFAWGPCWDCGLDTIPDGCKHPVIYDSKKREHGCYMYRASCEDNEYPSADTWHPSIHMPKAAARIWLKVKSVSIQKLQKCGEGWCIEIEKEGVVAPQDPILYTSDDAFHDALRAEFQKLWNSTIKKEDIDQYGWNANPWVWVIEFERCEKPKGV